MEDYLLTKLEIGNKIRQIFLDFLWEKISGNWRENEGMIGCVGVLWWSFDEDFFGNISVILYTGFRKVKIIDMTGFYGIL